MPSIIIFQEKNFLFGLDLSQFDKHFLLDQTLITPSKGTSQQWEYQDKEQNTSGTFLHFGGILGLHPATFSHEGSVFIKSMPENTPYGIYVNNFIAQVPYEKVEPSFYKLGSTVNIPENTPWTFFQNAFKYKRRTVLLLDPIEILTHFFGKKKIDVPPVETKPHPLSDRIPFTF